MLQSTLHPIMSRQIPMMKHWLQKRAYSMFMFTTRKRQNKTDHVHRKLEKELRIVNEYLKQERADHQETQKELRKIKESLKGVQANCKGLQQKAKKGKNDERDLISKAQKAYECRNEMAAIIKAGMEKN